jgi:hypothetical protein
VWQDKHRAEGADEAGLVRGVDIGQESAGNNLPRSFVLYRIRHLIAGTRDALNASSGIAKKRSWLTLSSS